MRLLTVPRKQGIDSGLISETSRLAPSPCQLHLSRLLIVTSQSHCFITLSFSFNKEIVSGVPVSDCHTRTIETRRSYHGQSI